MTPAVVVPEALRQRYQRTREGRVWLDELPALIQESLRDFRMRLDTSAGPEAWHGQGSLVLPVVASDGLTPAVLKFPYPHSEAATESAALELWNGNG